MPRGMFVTEFCPVCAVSFTGSQVVREGDKSPSKQCPNGHWTRVHVLAKARWKPVASATPIMPPKAKPEPMAVPRNVLHVLRGVGIAGEREVLRLAVAGMLSGFDQAMATLPKGSVVRNLVEGAFGKAPEMARRILLA